MTVERFSSHEVLESFRLCFSVPRGSKVVVGGVNIKHTEHILHVCRQSDARHSSVIQSDLAPKAASTHREHSSCCASPLERMMVLVIKRAPQNHMRIHTL